MTFWPWWLGAACLGGLVVASWGLERRLVAGSGSITRLSSALLDRNWGVEEERLLSDQDELQAALLAATLAEFGDQGADEPLKLDGNVIRTWAPAYSHAVFLAMIAVGGLISALATGSFQPRWSLDAAFAEVIGTGPAMIGALVVGGLCVGFGTRMASGCTTGHGLCGVSRFQPGSFLATGIFFGTAVVVSYGLEFLL